MATAKKRLKRQDVDHLAWLARVQLTRRERSLFAQQLADILAYFRKLDELDTERIPPTYHVLDLVNVLRPDEAKPSSPEELLRNAPETKGRYVKAPRMA